LKCLLQLKTNPSFLVFSPTGWNELLIAAFSHRSISVKDGILLATGLHVHRSSAHQAGVGTIFDRVLTELVSKMREMKMDKTELGCLRAIVLYNPGNRCCFFAQLSPLQTSLFGVQKTPLLRSRKNGLYSVMVLLLS